jgi:2-iminobutanoate/2-iminopropanoate deaminase
MSTRARKEVFYIEQGQKHTSPIPEGVRAGGFIFLSAIRGVDPATSRVETDDPEEQARRAFAVVKATLEAMGATMEDIVKIAVYMKDMSDRTAFNKVWAEVFPKDPPARFAVQVMDMGAPGDKSKYLLDVTALAP